MARVHIVAPSQRIPEPQDGIDSANRRTIDSYERIAREYAKDTAPDPSGAAGFSGEGLRRLVEALPAGGTVLEVGSGPGWNADFVESQVSRFGGPKSRPPSSTSRLNEASRSTSSMSPATNSADRTTR